MCYLCLSQGVKGDVALPSVGPDASASRKLLKYFRNSEIAVDYTGVLATGETVVWEKDFDPSVRIKASDGRRLIITGANYSDSGVYQPLVVTAQITRRGQICRIEVLPQNAIINLSIRADFATVKGPTIVGFVVDGEAPLRRMLFRAIGPGLAPFGVSNRGAVQEIVLYNAKGVVLTRFYPNKDVGSVIAMNAYFSMPAGAFPATVGDVISPYTLEPGAFTMHVVPASGGDVLIEVYSLPQ
jgi:hypothetical protein